MRINYNSAAYMSASCLRKSETRLNNSLERLSTGLKINHGKDNPSGLAVGRRMNLQIKGVGSSSENAQDGISIIETADGALSEIHNILQRINELTVQSANGTMTDNDRSAIMDEANQLKSEITRISKDTDFNGQPLLNGGYDLKGYTDKLGCRVSSYSDSVKAGDYSISMDIASIKAITSVDTDIVANNTIEVYDNRFVPSIKLDTAAGYRGNYDHETGKLTVEGKDGFSIELTIDEAYYEAKNGTGQKDIKLDLTGIGAMTLQVGANEGQTLEMRIPEISLHSIGIENLDVSTQGNAQKSLDLMGKAINFISDVRGRLGAYQNRLESTKASLDITEENMTAAYSRLMDLDMAEEMTEYSSVQVLTEAGTTMVAQANQRPAQVLQLLQ